MTNNDILRRIRYIFNINDTKMMATFALAELSVTREQISNWLKKEEDAAFEELSDNQLAIFLNGLIIKNRGKKEGPQPIAEQHINYNVIFRKLKIALDFKDDDILEALQLAEFPISKHELSALFRRPDHKHYRECQTQILRNFLKGLQLKYRENSEENPKDDVAN